MRQRRMAPHGARRPTAPRGAVREPLGERPGARQGGEAAATADAAERDTLVRVAAAAAGASNLDEVIELAAEAACDAIDAGSFSISRWERESSSMRTLINVGTLGSWEERFPENETYPLDESPATADLLLNAKPYFASIDDPEAPEASVALLNSLGKESEIGVPIVVNGEVWGELWASTCPGDPRFRGRDVRFLEAIAGQLAAVIGRAELFTNVSRMAYEDPLTGLANRRAFEEALEPALARAKTSGGALTLMLCDVDDLKSINDGRGHQAGDRALRRVGEALVAACATLPAALIGRLSGDEFAVLIEGSGLDSARDLSSTALSLLRRDRDVNISLSCGAAAVVAGVDTPERLIRAADTAQYAAKRRGGGQLCTAGATPGDERSGSRRRARGRHAGDHLERTTGRLLAQLDGDYAHRSTIDRLEVVISGVADVLNCAGWTVSLSVHGSAEITSMCVADDRDTRLRGVRVDLDDEVYALADYPATAALVAAGTGTFLVDRHDRSADPAERALLAELGYSSVLGVGVSDLDGVYLLELYADADTTDLHIVDVSMSLLARAAAGRPLGVSERVRQLQKRTHHLTAGAGLGARLAGMVDAREITEVAVDEVHRELGHPVCSVVQLTDDGEVRIVAARGSAAERLRDEGWRQGAGLGLLGRALRERGVVRVRDVREEPDYRLTRETYDTRSEMCVPLFDGERLWGAMDINHTRVDAFDADDATFLRMVADQVGQALRSASLYAQLERAFVGTAEALVSALEAKDSYTAAHSRSIAANAEALGRVFGLGESDLRTLRFGAAFHDIGKLAIPESVLNKPGPLTPAERLLVERHTVIGDQILAPIEFLAEVRPLVRAGHERWDGAGYPDGLAGEEILLGARIIFACDTYDAMTSERPYRAALSAAAARAELAGCAGTQLDPRVVEALLDALGSPDAAAA